MFSRQVSLPAKRQRRETLRVFPVPALSRLHGVGRLPNASGSGNKRSISGEAPSPLSPDEGKVLVPGLPFPLSLLSERDSSPTPSRFGNRKSLPRETPSSRPPRRGEVSSSPLCPVFTEWDSSPTPPVLVNRKASPGRPLPRALPGEGKFPRPRFAPSSRSGTAPPTPPVLGIEKPPRGEAFFGVVAQRPWAARRASPRLMAQMMPLMEAMLMLWSSPTPKTTWSPWRSWM